ncbi:50S ribosomal protein L35 [Thermus filiformis]|uniref:Large ribosomal subunit protein bL35 n=1 Tax=Thermus filiformis TaxID=276 RepID=A0A0A2WUA0_THEFI|nr:50S ribosomal protein L35 [Thermus filiformis]KGQ22352.2 50S ribosomal protein L35 [Thermus filiformis]
MPKMKTHKGAKKRVKVTASGKVVAMKTGKRHLNWHKSGKTIRQKGKKFTLAEQDARRIRELMPYEGR